MTKRLGLQEYLSSMIRAGVTYHVIELGKETIPTLNAVNHSSEVKQRLSI